MSKFNVGDRVRIARPGRNLEEWQDFEAEVLRTDEGDDPYLKPLSERPWGGFASFWWPAKDLELVASAKPDLRAALDKIKRDNGLCGEFDEIVDEMLSDDPMVRLKYAALRENRLQLFYDLEAALKPKPSMEIPDKGRWVKATMGDGSTREFEVTTNYEGTESTQVANGTDTDWINDVYMMRIPHNPGEDSHNEPETVVIDWEYIEAPKPPAKVGDVFGAGTSLPVAGVYRFPGGKTFLTAGYVPASDLTLVWIDEDAKC